MPGFVLIPERKERRDLFRFSWRHGFEQMEITERYDFIKADFVKESGWVRSTLWAWIGCRLRAVVKFGK
jgi:hypothetical protein